MEQAQILEEKMALQQKLLAAAGVENMLESPNYCNLAAEDTDSSTMWQEVLSAVQVLFFSYNQSWLVGSELLRATWVVHLK